MQHGKLVLTRAESPIQHPETKLGGWPVWVEQPAWPVSRATGELMLFLGQVCVEPSLFPVEPGLVAYLFMTGGEPRDLETWDPHSGENAVILQRSSPGRNPIITEGPCLHETFWEEGIAMQRPIELAATLSIGEELPEIEYDEYLQLPSERQAEYDQQMGLKMGGTPEWIQGDEIPEGWRLLVQIPDYPELEGKCIQTDWNFGTGVCYVLISPGYTEGLLLWQCG